MNILEQAQRYLNAIPSAVSGDSGHNQTFSVAMALVEGFALSVSDARPLMIEYSQRCSPPWSEREIDHKLADADNRADPAKRGKLISKGVRYKMSKAPAMARPVQSAKPAPAQQPKKTGVKYEIPDSTELPNPLPDGARQFLRNAFQAGEGIRVCIAKSGDEGREIPRDAGVTLSREEWLKKLDAHQGNPNGFLKTGDRNGIFISVNPMKIGGSKDADVTAFRHALLEFDEISREEQFSIISQSRIPCSAIISSGKKSIHAWVKVEAKDRKEFDDRVKALYQHFAEYRPDEKNKNPSRFSRLPFCERGSSRQELLALNVGCESFAEWLAEQEVQGLGTPITPSELDAFQPESDANNLLGNRWLGRGMACLLVGPSGVGKSSLNMQMAIGWAVGQAANGIKPERALKSVIVQAENDIGDLAEMFKGVCTGLGIEPLSEEWELLQKNLIFVRDNTHTGLEFIESLRRIIDRYKPDLLWLDPILSFVGADLSRQEVIGQFFRNWLNPVLDASGIACFCIHHTGKPPSDSKARQHWQTSDFAYAGLGSSDLTNWARAVMVLQDRGEGLFELKMAKRGKRAGILGEDGGITTSVWLRHSTDPTKIFWESAKAPEKPPEADRKGGKPSDVQRVATMNLHSFCAACTAEGEGMNEVAKRLEGWLANEGEDLSFATCKRIVPALVKNGKLQKCADSKYRKGKNA